MRQSERNAVLALVACAGALVVLRCVQQQMSRLERTTSQSRASSSRGVKRKAPMSSTLADEMKDLIDAVRKVVHAVSSTTPRVRTAEEIFEAVKKMGLEGHDLLDAVDWLVAHPNLIEIFFGCPDDLRLQWLSSKMRI